MGLFNKKDNKQNEIQPIGDTGVVPVEFSDGSNILASNPKFYGKPIIHSDGSQYALMMFDVSNYAKAGETIYMTTPYKVFVEKALNPDGSVNDLTDAEISGFTVEYVNQLISGYHDNAGICRYIGRLDPLSRQMIISPSVKTAVKEKIEPEIVAEIRAKNEQKRMMVEQREAEEQRKSMAKAQAQVNQYREDEDRKKQERIQAGRFEKVRSKENDRNKVDDYDGVDLNSGYVLRVRNLCKHGKDQNGVYLYSADVSTTPNEHDVEMFNAGGKTVAFTTKIKIEDLVSNIPNGKRKALELFTLANEKAEVNNGAQFICNLDERGEIYSTELSHCSDAIQNTYKDINQRALNRQEALRQRYAKANRSDREMEI